MAEELTPLTEWVFMAECSIPKDIGPLLVKGEQPVRAYKTLRDSAVFTTHRLIFRDSQGVRGKKVEIFSLPYRNILMWASENAGTMEMSSELKLWTRVGQVNVKIGRGVDVRKLDRIISQAVLGG